MQIELGYTDIFSLEPVDDQNRPFGIKKRLFKEYKKQKQLEAEAVGESVDLQDEKVKYEGKDEIISDDISVREMNKLKAGNFSI